MIVYEEFLNYIVYKGIVGIENSFICRKYLFCGGWFSFYYDKRDVNG